MGRVVVGVGIGVLCSDKKETYIIMRGLVRTTVRIVCGSHLPEVLLLGLSKHPLAQLRAPKIYQLTPPLLLPQLDHQRLFFRHLL